MRDDLAALLSAPHPNCDFFLYAVFRRDNFLCICVVLCYATKEEQAWPALCKFIALHQDGTSYFLSEPQGRPTPLNADWSRQGIVALLQLHFMLLQAFPYSKRSRHLRTCVYLRLKHCADASISSRGWIRKVSTRSTSLQFATAKIKILQSIFRHSSRFRQLNPTVEKYIEDHERHNVNQFIQIRPIGCRSLQPQSLTFSGWGLKGANFV